MLRCLFVALILASAVLAQSPAPVQTANPQPGNPNQSSTEEAKKGKLEGTVVNALTKEPVRRAEVVLMPVSSGNVIIGPSGPPGTRRVTTDAEGKYTIVDVEPGRYSLQAQKAGFVRGLYGIRSRASASAMGMGTQLRFDPGQAITGARIEMLPQAVILGRVVDEEGEPVQNARVEVMQSRYINGKRQMTPSGGATTNDRGEFRIPNLSPGQIILSAMPDRNSGAGITDAEPDKAYVRTYHPGVIAASQAARIDVAAGADLTGFEIKLTKSKVVRVSGKAVDAAGKPLNNTMVLVMQRDSFFGSMDWFSATQDGKFEIRGVPAGPYSITLQRRDGRASYREDLDVSTENIENLIVRMPDPFVLEGQIILPPESKIDPKSVRINLSDEAGRFFVAPGRQQVMDDGRFTMEDVSPGKYRVTVMPGMNSDSYVASIEYGDKNALGSPVPITGPGTPLKIHLSSGVGTVEGTATDGGQPAAGVYALLLPVDPARRSNFNDLRMSPTDQAASFRLINVPPGEYYAFAFDGVEFGSWQDPEWFEKVRSKAVKVTVQPGGKETVALSVTVAPEP